MDYYILILLIWLLIVPIDSQNSISITKEPPSGQIHPGATIKLTCAIQYSNTRPSIIWQRKSGDIVFGIGVNAFLNQQQKNMLGSRYSLEILREGPANVAYTLSITDAILEDSGTILCVQSPQTNINTSTVISICPSTENRFCECISSVGWLSPTCLISDSAASNSNEYYKKTVIGLGITLALTTVYVIIMAFIFGRDCLTQMYKESIEKRKQEENLIKVYKARNNKTVNKSIRSDIDNRDDMDTTKLTSAIISDTCSDDADTAASSIATNFVSEASSSGYQGSTDRNESSVREKGRRGRKQQMLAETTFHAPFSPDNSPNKSTNSPPNYGDNIPMVTISSLSVGGVKHGGNNGSYLDANLTQNNGVAYNQRSRGIAGSINNISGDVDNSKYLKSIIRVQQQGHYLENTPGTHI